MNRLTSREAITILKGDFSEVAIKEDESHSDLFEIAFQMAIECIKRHAKYEWYLASCIEAIGHCEEKAKNNGDLHGECFYFLESEKYRKIKLEYEDILNIQDSDLIGESPF